MAIDRGQGQQSTQLVGIINPNLTTLTTVQTAANEAAHLALTAQEGDVVVRTDENKTYMHNDGVAGTMSDYTIVSFQLEELTDGTADVVGSQDELVYLDSGQEKRKLISEIELSEFKSDILSLNGGYF
jgi:phage protein U